MKMDEHDSIFCSTKQGPSTAVSLLKRLNPRKFKTIPTFVISKYLPLNYNQHRDGPQLLIHHSEGMSIARHISNNLKKQSRERLNNYTDLRHRVDDKMILFYIFILNSQKLMVKTG